jgi:hypothetical protein
MHVSPALQMQGDAMVQPVTQVAPGAQHTPSEQESVPGQAFVQEPQVDGEVRSASQPLVGLPSQSSRFASQLSIVQAPEAHAAVAPGNEHALPQAPQCITVSRLCSHPFPGAPSQSPSPPMHVYSQSRETHDGMEPGRLH